MINFYTNVTEMNRVQKQITTRIFGLDVIRALAIVLVLLSHLYYLNDSVNPMLISLSGLAGYSGVELFFVLSGFLIGSIVLKQFISDEFSLKTIFIFLKRRWFRTLPNYYLILLFNLLIAYFLHYGSDNWYQYFYFFQNFSVYNISFFSESWSLSVEEWTYILLPFSLLFVWTFRNRLSKKGLFIIVILFLILLAHILRFLHFSNESITNMDVWNTNLKSIVIYRFDTILFGVVLAWIYHFYTDFLYQKRVYFLILAVHLFFIQFVILNVLGIDITTNPIYFQVFYFTLSSLTFSLALPFFIFWKKSNFLFSKAVVFVSKISYAMYLLHYSIIVVLLKQFLFYYNLQFSGLSLFFMYFGITISLSYIVYRFYEKPMMKLRDKF